jgi:FtsP/CotA-like multicopper oxidase with cupredoxin domain
MFPAPPQVNEMPGTYFYHDHSNLNRADGLQGPLIVKERPGSSLLFEADADQTLFLSDWWHFTGNAMALRLNR